MKRLTTYQIGTNKNKLKFDHYHPFLNIYNIDRHSCAKDNDKPMPVLLYIYFGKLKLLKSLRVGWHFSV